MTQWARFYSVRVPVRKGLVRRQAALYREAMNILLTIILIAAVVLLIVGGLVEAVRFLLWVGLILVIIAVIVWALRVIAGRRR